MACPFFQKAFGWCVPIGGLAGLIGLGGGVAQLHRFRTEREHKCAAEK
jgi:hypothetical protein